ncbi:N-acetyltransferase [Kitasatospora xanthocidica]|uniref:N-acetyltransferase n=2 Tax=Kitasatospora xanthocidica TaxID=83382 RepID=A0A372ZQ52_9ACTN|nr:N-acetyltransferase [Kitasatospora xanthocidica]
MARMVRPRDVIDRGDLVLRRWRGQRDFAAAFTLIEESLDHLRPWEPWVARHDEEHTRALLDRCDSWWASGEVYTYAIAEDGAPVGMCQAVRAAEPGGRRVGYWLHPAATGRGLATRAVAALAEEVFTLPGTAYLEIVHDRANTASAAVPRRLGFTELRSEPAVRPVAPAGSGTAVVWRLDRPARAARDSPRGRPPQ